MEKVKETFKELQKRFKENFVANSILLMIVALIIFLSLYIWYISNLSKRECSLMDSLYQTKPTYISSFKNVEVYTFKDYYIKTAYNCCSGGSYKNDFVSDCPLKNIIKQGVRGLDFEIYSIDDEPVVATSTVPSNYIKETYNSINFSTVMEVINNSAFMSDTCPNPDDPIILHLRIKSTNQTMLSNMAKIFSGYADKMLEPVYSYEYTSDINSTNQFYTHNLGNVKLTDLCGKYVIIVDRINAAFMDNKDFYEYVNMTSSSMFMRALNYYDVKFTPDMNELQEYNKKNMTIAMPDVGINPENPSGVVCREMGCQLIAMRYQLFDANLQENMIFFDIAGSAFALKPERLRYIEQTIEETPPNPPELNFATRSITTDYYSIQT